MDLSFLVQAVQRGFQYLITRTVSKNVSAYQLHKEELRKNPLRVFIAYDKDDEQKVRDLYGKLKAQPGIDPWLDRESEIKDIPREAKELWGPPLEKALREADCAMICLSRESIANRNYFQKKEVPFILKTAKEERELDTYVILVKLEQCTTPRKYEAWEVSDLYVEGGYDKLLDTIVQAYEDLKDKRGIRFEFKSPSF